jgi:hypothetical protein
MAEEYPMPGTIESRTDTARDLTVYTVSGEFTAEQVSETIREFYAGDPTSSVLWDFTAASFEKISATVPQQMAGETRVHSEVRIEGGKTALVFGSDVGYGLGRMFETFQDLQNAPVEYQTFRSLDEAHAWLGGGPTE